MEPLAGVAAPSRAAHVVHLAPAEPSRLARLALPSLSGTRDATAVRTLVLTADADTAVAVAEHITRDPAGAGFAALTSGPRGARLLAHRTPSGVACTPATAAALRAQAALPLTDVGLVVIQLPGEGDTAALDALDTVLAELPKGARRLLLAPAETAALEAVVDRHMLKARRVREDVLGEPEPDAAPLPVIRALSTGHAARWVTVRRLLDELDPASAVLLVGDETEAAAARGALAALGHPTDGAVRVTTEAPPAHVTLACFASIPTAARLAEAVAAEPAHLVVLCAPGELPSLRALAGPASVRSWNLDGPLAQAAARESVTRARLRGLLTSGALERELRTLAPLFDEFDASEIAAAALALATEAERKAAAVYVPDRPREAAASSEPERARSAPSGAAPRDRGERPERGARPARSGGFGGPRGGGERSGGFGGPRGGGERSGGFGGPRGGGERSGGFGGPRGGGERSGGFGGPRGGGERSGGFGGPRGGGERSGGFGGPRGGGERSGGFGGRPARGPGGPRPDRPPRGDRPSR